MARPSFYLDTQIYSYLANGRIDLAVARRLRILAATGACRVFGSVNSLEELAGWALADQKGYEAGIGLLLDACQQRILLPWQELLTREVRKGAQLSIPEACLDANEYAGFVRISGNIAQLKEVAAEVASRKADFASTLGKASFRFEAAAAEKWSGQERKAFISTFEVDERQVRVWYRDFLGLSKEKLGLADDEAAWPDAGSLPCWRAYVAIHLALVKMRHRDGRKYEGADLYDAKHYVHAAIAGTLVSNDGALKRASEIVRWKALRVIGPADFARIINQC